jgi:NAD-dependent SIR2 family protein deacetylase
MIANAEKLQITISNADAVVIGAGAGLSVSAGFTYSGERFDKHFSEYEKYYGFNDMYHGGFYPYDSLEEMWGYWCKFVAVNRYENPQLPVYDNILMLVKDKEYFVLTTNVDHCFQKAGFNKERLFYTQGDYGLFQCSVPCCQKTYDNKDAIEKMVQSVHQLKIPSELVPKCPVCGAPMSMNLRSDNTFVQDEGWYAAAKRYEGFIKAHNNGRILFLELGVGYNTPGIIKYPFWQMTNENENAVYACINYGDAYAPREIKERSICINADIGDVINDIIKSKRLT